MDHFCPSRPGVTPGLQDHSYTSVWCNTRPLGPPPPVSGIIPGLQDLLCRLLGNWYPTTPCWEFPGIVPRTPGILLDHSPGIIPGLKDHLPGVFLGILPTPVALLGKTRPLGFYLPRDFSERPYLYHSVSKVCACYTFKRQNTPYIAVFLSENSLFPSV